MGCHQRFVCYSYQVTASINNWIKVVLFLLIFFILFFFYFSLSYDGGTLVCVSKGTGRSVLTIWSNDDIIRTITDVDINVLRISPFDNNR